MLISIPTSPCHDFSCGIVLINISHMTKVNTLVAKELGIMESGENSSQGSTECGKQWDEGVTLM